MKTNVYELRNGYRSIVSLVRGRIIDLNPYYSMSELNSMIYKTTMVIPDETPLDTLSNATLVYKARMNMDDGRIIWTPFFLKRNDLVEEINKSSCVGYNIFSTSFIGGEPYDTVDHVALRKTGIVDEVRKGKDGYYVLINTYPNYYGRNHKESGKVFFVDRSKWEGPLDVGMAMVKIISEGKDKNYVSGHMVQYGDLALDDVMQYLYDTYELSSDNPGRIKTYTISRVESPVHGNYFTCAHDYAFGGLARNRLCKADDGKVTEVPVTDSDLNDISNYSKWTHDPIEIEFLDLFGIPLEESKGFDDIFGDRYHECWYIANDSKFGILWQYLNGCPTGCSDILIDAYRYGLIKFMYYDQNIYAVTIEKYDLEKFLEYDVDEIDEILKEASDVNRRAEEAIKSRIAKGKIRYIG